MEEREIELYQRLARQFRGTPGQIGAGSRQSQEVRFEVMVQLLDGLLGKRWTRMRLLDFGCGKGDLAPFLIRHTDFDPACYIGLDAIPENIEDARRLGDYDFRLGIWDGRGRIVEEEIDLIVFSGALNTSRIERRQAMFRSMLDLSRVGVAGNFLTFNSRVKKDYGPDNILLDPEDCLKWVDRGRFRTRLRLDYFPHDFSIAAVRWEA